MFRAVNEAGTMVTVQCSPRYSTTSSSSAGLTEAMSFSSGRTTLFADYGVLLLSSLENEEGFHLWFCSSYDDYDEKGGLCTETRVSSLVTAQQTPSF